MNNVSKFLFSISLGLVLILSVQSAFAINAAAKAAAAAAADTAKSNDTTGLPAADQIAQAGYDAADKPDENLASELACLVYEESGRAGVEEVSRETAAKAAATATGAPPGTVIFVCDEAYAYTVTSSSGLGSGAMVALLLIGGGAAGAGGGGDNIPTSP